MLKFAMVGAVTVALLVAAQTLADTTKSDRERAARISGLMTAYYNHPQPELIPEIIRNIGTLRRTTKDPLPSLTGFLAGVFRQHPDKVNSWITAKSEGNAEAETVLINALWLAGLRSVAQTAMNEFRWPSDRVSSVKSSLANVPEIGEYTARVPADQDMLWGAFFASGDTKYVQKILEAYTDVANLPNVPAEDIAFVADSTVDPAKRDQLKERTQHYSQDIKRRLLIASAALWSLSANAIQHGRVHQALAQYVRQHEYGPAMRVLARHVARSGPKFMRGGFTGPVQVFLAMTQDPSFAQTQVPEIFKGKEGHPVVPDRIFDRTNPIFLAVIAATKSPAKARVDTEVIDPEGRRIRFRPDVLPRGDVKEEASITTSLIPMELTATSPPGMYFAEVTVRPTEGPVIFFGISFLIEEKKTSILDGAGQGDKTERR